MSRLTDEVNSKVPELYDCRQKYKKQLNEAIKEVNNVVTELSN